MKLSKVYANTEKFKSIIFNDGLNIIYGDVEESKESVSEHNIGKTSLVGLIDFLLLKEIKKDSVFTKQRDKFADWVFFLEIELNDRSYLTIKRSVHPSKISFKHHQSKQRLVDEEHWDYEDLSLGSKDLAHNPKHIFQSKFLRFDVIPEYNFRSFLPYILRKQSDFNDVFELASFHKHRDWKPMIFNLLGFQGSLLNQKYDLDEELEENKKLLTKLKDKDDPQQAYALKAAIAAKEAERDELKKISVDFDFFKKEEGINYDLVKNIEEKVSELNQQAYEVAYALEQVRVALDSSAESPLDVRSIQDMFAAVQVYLPDNLVKEYEEVVDFSSKITKERKKYLREELHVLLEKQGGINTELRDLNQKRSHALLILKEKDTFVKYKQYQDELIKVEGEISTYNAKLEAIKTTENYQKSIENTRLQIKNLAEEIKSEIGRENSDYKAITVLFQEIYRRTFEYTALLVVQPNSSNNIEFKTQILGGDMDFTGKDEGYTSTRVLCASFVLAILAHYADRSFFRFAYHDGIFDSWGDNHKKQFLNLIRELCLKHGLQYTVSMIKSDLPRGFNFQDGEIVRTLSKNDFLFGFEF